MQWISSENTSNTRILGKHTGPPVVFTILGRHWRYGHGLPRSTLGPVAAQDLELRRRARALGRSSVRVYLAVPRCFQPGTWVDRSAPSAYGIFRFSIVTPF